MTMIKCSECGKDISDTAPACVGCGAPIAVAAGHKPLDVKSISGVVNLDSSEKSEAEKAASEKSCACFKSALESTIQVKFAEIMRGKIEANKHLVYADAKILTASVRNVFRAPLGFVPPQVEAACKLSEAVLAPSAQEKMDLIKAVIGIGGTSAGVALIIAGVGTALGWGASVVTTVVAFFVGSPTLGPLGAGLAGVILAGIATYFATSGSEAKDTERFMDVLNSSTDRAVDAIWLEHEIALVKVLNRESAA